MEVPDELVPGSGKRAQQITNLRPFNDRLRAEFDRSPGNEMTFARVSAFLRAQPAFSDTADAYRLPTAGRFVKFLRLFGWEIRGSGPGMVVRKPPAAARPASSSGAASSSSDAMRGRPLGALDIAPRMPRTSRPAETALAFTPDNPHRPGTAAHARYEAYKSATTVGEARTAGANPMDIKSALEKGYAILQ